LTQTSTKYREKLEALRDKPYQEAHASAGISAGVSTQIQQMRKERNWSQRALAEKIGTKQPAVSRIENAESGPEFQIRTLLKIASAFDVGLMVRFVPFDEVLDDQAALTYDQIAPPSLAEVIEGLDKAESADSFVKEDTVGRSGSILRLPEAIAAGSTAPRELVSIVPSTSYDVQFGG
jgi:transcriptional regulator with XRE-family HTH domain